MACVQDRGSPSRRTRWRTRAGSWPRAPSWTRFALAFICYGVLNRWIQDVALTQPLPVDQCRAKALWVGRCPEREVQINARRRESNARRLRAAEVRGEANASQPALWRPGPALLRSSTAKRAQLQLKHDPMLVLFDATVKEELAMLNKKRKREVESKQLRPPGALREASQMMVLRRRMSIVRQKELMLTVAELMYLMVCGMFKHLEVPFIPPLKFGGDVRFDVDGEQLRGLTELYSLEALELVRDHLFGIINVQARSQTAPLRIALFQAGQVYAMSALFGYYLRRADTRYQMEKLMWSYGNSVQTPLDGSGQDRSRRRPTPEWMQLDWAKGEKRASVSLKDYIERFSSAELRNIRTVTSVEASVALEKQVSALFGDLRTLKSRLLHAIGEASSDEEASQKLQQAILEQRVESIRISCDDLRRLILEAVGFGSALYDAEREVESVCDLTPTGR
eukprot:TRINITY_DN36283_c0_g1_i1.p1 TRINITY_DN36283_c0_g1~~TRINITY_DN36283_c0_g1_i1.p1  ORF type:complete len:452 (+),score=88.85 TRINITY_DN36283_c0_g1_i1:32-1387(+)